MDGYELYDIGALLRNNSYVGRGIIIGTTADGKHAAAAYFIMGRSENSRNRIFVEKDDEVVIHPFDASRIQDPSLIIYSPIRRLGNRLIVTNGDQTDTIFDALTVGKSFSEALRTRSFEPDAPHFTSRISGLLTFLDDGYTYEMSILKSVDENGTACSRFTFAYPASPGLGHFLHTYACDGDPLPTFRGEPERVRIPDDIDALTDSLWGNLNEENKISLYVRYIDLGTGAIQNRMRNKKLQEGAMI